MKKSKIILIGLFAIMAVVLSACAMGPRAVGTPGMTADGDVVYVSYQQYVYAINAQNGTEIWRYPADGNAQIVFYAPPEVTEDSVYVGDLSNKFYKLNKENGLEQWTFSDAKGWFMGKANEGEGVIYAPSSDRGLYAVSSANGSLNWKFETGHQIWAQPVLIKNGILQGSMDQSVYGLSLSGAQLWQMELNGAIVAAPVYDEVSGKVYIPTIGKSIFALDASTGKVIWQFDTDSSLWSSPLLVDDQLVFSDEIGNIYLLDAERGKLVWKIESGGQVMGGLVEIEGGFVVVTEDSYVRSFDFERNPLWTRTVSGELYSTPVNANGIVVVAAIKGDNLLYGFDMMGNQVWAFKPGK
ncbi:MAG: PQQ-binding-like beta-propeller repeat protein [Anaerolineaceae bacterium]|nr:PQQ-binding-like beta-propeller repeat protein [Anaerolineaceae bacterium]